jgi:hypothetical protein
MNEFVLRDEFHVAYLPGVQGPVISGRRVSGPQLHLLGRLLAPAPAVKTEVVKLTVVAPQPLTEVLPAPVPPPPAPKPLEEVLPAPVKPQPQPLVEEPRKLKLKRG